MEHSRSLPDGLYVLPGQRSLPSNHESLVKSPTNTTSPPSRLNQQSRRLQLRNVGFRGPVLPARRISPILSASQHASESSSRAPNTENTPISTDKRTLYGEDLPPSSVNILQEIHNSKRRKRVSPRSGVGQIFEDNTATVSTEGSGTSWYNETSNNSSPVGLNMMPINNMKLREVSLNGKTTPPLSSPLAKQMIVNNENRPGLRSASLESAKYIEHLEAQLSTANAVLDSVTSPSTNKARSAKLRALTAESRSLRQEISEWERHFAQRVEEETGQRVDVEAGLRTRLQGLENDLKVRDAKIRELETELEGIRAKVRDVEVLEVVNIDLERRIDVLTNLLVRSPTKLDLCSPTSSPSKTDLNKKTPRPKSMLPRVPFSPCNARPLLSTVSESGFRHSMSFESTSNISESPERANSSAIHEEAVISPLSNHNSRRFSSTDLNSGTSTLFHLVPSSSSRPTSIQSASSFGTASWGLPLPPDTESQAKNRQRRMRRFPSGSCSLKPLILPTATTTPSFLTSAPVYLSSPTPSRNITEVSLDPTTAFLSRHDCSSPTSTSMQQNRRDSVAWAQEQALRSLEGRYRESESVDLQSSDFKERCGPLNKSPVEEQRSGHTRPRSLQEELDQAKSFDESFEDGLIPIDLETSAQLDPVPIGVVPLTSYTPSHDDLLRKRQPSVISDTTPKPPPKRASTAASPSKSTPSSNVTAKNASCIFSRLINLITRTKQDPLALAQRLLRNAWMLSSGRLSGVGWWLIGLVLGSSANNKRDADGGIADGRQPQLGNEGFDWHHYSARASRRRTGEHYLRVHEAECQMQAKPQPRSSNTVSSRPTEEPQIFPCDTCIEPSSHRTLRLWWRFSLAIVIVVGVAIKHGPGVLLVDDSLPPRPPPSARRISPRLLSHQPLKRDSVGLGISQNLTCRKAENDGCARGTNTFTFLEPLGPGDFEDT